MIDTVVIRLHNIKRKYKRLIRALNMEDKTGYRLEIGIVPTEEMNEMQKYHKDAVQVFNMLKLNKTGEFLIKTQSSKRKSTSGHYEFSYIINISKDYLEMNFSIPKYQFGSNVFMYVEHQRDVYFKYYENRLLDYNIKKAPDLFMWFIKHFLKSEFIVDTIDLEDVEINRIDTCFNQVFSSKQEALYYHSYQKKIRKKHSRDEDSKKIDYDTSVMFANARYGSKIYHKGSEYKKTDLKQHLRINQEKGFEFFKTDKIQELADRTLRYEITFRNAELNYLFKHNIFRKNCPEFKIELSIYNKVYAIKQRNNRLTKHIGNLPKDERAMYLKYNPYESLRKSDKMNYKAVSQIMESCPKFMLKENRNSEVYNSVIVVNMTKYPTALFSKQLLTLCLKKLESFIKEFQLKELPSEEVISIKIDRNNSMNRHKLPKADMIQFYELLASSGSFKEASRISRYSRATLYRYKARFKKIGIDEKNMQPEENFEFPKASIDLQSYHNFLLQNSELIKGRHIHYGL